MPIGSAKIGVLGAGLVPGGSQTFNASGTFTVPPGVKKVNITGKGGTGNPGNAGNPGNTGSPGGGGSGAGGGRIPNAPAPSAGGPGFAYGGLDGNFTNSVTIGQGSGLPGLTGNSGQAGTAGQAGSAGNPGQSSSGICKTFPGGAGGNAGAAGNAGNAGSGGQGGTSTTTTTGGAGGNGGGSGASTVQSIPANSPCANPLPYGGGGGGGAGATNDGSPGVNANPSFPAPCGITRSSRGGKGGNTSNYCVPLSPDADFRTNGVTPVGAAPTNITGGMGSYGPGFPGPSGSVTASPAIGCSAGTGGGSPLRLRYQPQQPGVSIFCPYPINSPGINAVRSGGGGGGGSTGPSSINQVAGGGGGGGRGNAGNAGGAGGAGGSGQAGTPQTFNCVSVTPGSPYPITVATPGGQIVISWNPQ